MSNSLPKRLNSLLWAAHHDYDDGDVAIGSDGYTYKLNAGKDGTNDPTAGDGSATAHWLKIEPPSSGSSGRRIIFGGYLDAETSDRWLGNNSNQGWYTGIYNVSLGTGAEPSSSIVGSGPMVDAGETVDKIVMFFRANNAAVDLLHMRLVLRRFAAWDGTADDDADIIDAAVLTVDDLTVDASGWFRVEYTPDVTATHQAMLVAQIKATVGGSTDRFVQFHFEVDIS